MNQAQTLEYMTARIQDDIRLADKVPNKLPERLADAFTNWVKSIAKNITTTSVKQPVNEDKGKPATGETK